MPDDSSHADDQSTGAHARRTRLARNSVWNTIGWAGVLAMTIGTLPWFLRLLGETQYGLLALVMSIVAPLGVLDFGMSDATVKYLAESIGRGDMDAAKRYVHSSLGFSGIVGLLGAIVIIAIANPLVVLFNIPAEQQAVARTAMRWVGVLWCFMQVRQTLMGVVTALQRYDVLAVGTVLTQGSVIGAGLWILMSGGHLAEMLRTQALVAAGFAALWGILAWRLFPPIRLPVRVDLHSLRKTFGFGFWQMVNTLGGILSYQSQRWLLGILLPVRTVGYYNIGAQVVNIGYMASYKVGQVLFPEVSHMQGRGDEGGAARLAVNASWLLTTLSAMIFVPLVVFAHDLLRLYLGMSMADNSTVVLRILAIGTAVGCTFAIPSFYLLGTGRSQWLAAMSLLYGVATLAGCLVLIPILGIAGAGWGMSVATVVHLGTLVVLWWRVLHRWIPGNVYFASTFGPLLVGCGLAAGSLVVRDVISWDMGWIGLGIFGSLLAGITGVAIVIIDGGMAGGKQRRELLMNLVQKAARIAKQRWRREPK
jgi:O-antigen/teichoic acid export membrane protein